MKKESRKMLAALGVMTCLGAGSLASCSDEIDYTTDENAQLAFKVDTLRLDTMFTETTSATWAFCAYNHNGKYLRIKEARLESDGKSGFMINVDGQSGDRISDISVGGNDSIFVFVKARLDRNKGLEPELVTDNIIFSLDNGKEHRVRLEAYGQDCQAVRAKTIAADTTLTAESVPMVVFDSLVVAQDATLTIDQGTTVYFHPGSKLIVRGNLVTRGRVDAPVTLRGDRLDRMFTYLPYDRINDQWGGVCVESTCGQLALDHTDIHSSSMGVRCDNVKGDISIKNSVIHNVSADGLFLHNCKATVANTQISNAKGDCVNMIGGSVDLYHCTLAQFKPNTTLSTGRGYALTFHTTYDDADCPIVAANFYNCFITGYSKDEVYLYRKDNDEEVNLNFYNCVMMTDVSDEKYFHDCVEDDAKADVFAEKNFRAVDTHALYYDFRLDSLSTARGKGKAEYAREYPADRLGVVRGDRPDAGCYQFERK